MQSITAPVIVAARHRMQTDGQGVTTLVCFHGCPLRCRYCINPFSFAEDTRRTLMTPQQLYEQARIDELYYLATDGGVTFGGGEPLLYPAFLNRFRELCGPNWHLCAETSLSVPQENVRIAAQCVDMFYVDCKDTDPDIYRRYTGQDNRRMLENLKLLLEIAGPEKIVVRLPLIPGYNTASDRESSRTRLADMGILQFDLFTYQTDTKKS